VYLSVDGESAVSPVIPAGTAGSTHRRRTGGAKEKGMTYGHAERNLALILQLEAETRNLLVGLDRPDPEQSAWLQEVTSQSDQAIHQHPPETATASSF
jgi:hypothetical protein